jgi:hypothetical protein
LRCCPFAFHLRIVRLSCERNAKPPSFTTFFLAALHLPTLHFVRLKERKAMTRTRAAMFFRGMSKVMFVAMTMNLVLTNLFEVLAQALDLGLDRQALTMFSCMTCGLLTIWLQADARRAFTFARANGYVKSNAEQHGDLQIATKCPKRWLVMLHIELHPTTSP